MASVDLPGFGYSDRNPTYDHSQAHRNEDVWSLPETIDNTLESDLTNRPWNLAGHSMGGGTVAAIAIQNDSRL